MVKQVAPVIKEEDHEIVVLGMKSGTLLDILICQKLEKIVVLSSNL